jgi:hypothetical protein
MMQDIPRLGTIIEYKGSELYAGNPNIPLFGIVFNKKNELVEIYAQKYLTDNNSNTNKQIEEYKENDLFIAVKWFGHVHSLKRGKVLSLDIISTRSNIIQHSIDELTDFKEKIKTEYLNQKIMKDNETSNWAKEMWNYMDVTENYFKGIYSRNNRTAIKLNHGANTAKLVNLYRINGLPEQS